MKKVTHTARNIARGLVRGSARKVGPLAEMPQDDLDLTASHLVGAAIYADAAGQAADAAYLERLSRRVRRASASRRRDIDRRIRDIDLSLKRNG